MFSDQSSPSNRRTLTQLRLQEVHNLEAYAGDVWFDVFTYLLQPGDPGEYIEPGEFTLNWTWRPGQRLVVRQNEITHNHQQVEDSLELYRKLCEVYQQRGVAHPAEATGEVSELARRKQAWERRWRGAYNEQNWSKFPELWREWFYLRKWAFCESVAIGFFRHSFWHDTAHRTKA